MKAKIIVLQVFCALLTVMIFTNVSAQDKVLYHFNDAKVQGPSALKHASAQLDAAPDTQIIFVVFGEGFDLLFKGGHDQATGKPYQPIISALKERGVKFEVCENTLKLRNLKKDMFIKETDFTPSGYVRMTQLQTRERFAYIKP